MTMAHPGPDGPLQGCTVLDFTRYLAGPFATVILRDLGARVIKVESPRGDPSRTTGPFRNGDSAYFHAINRGKESLVVDLRDAGNAARLRKLALKVDCVVENYRPGVLEALGLDHASLRAEHPGLVYASCTGFGGSGPYASLPAFDGILQAMGGIMSVTGHPGGPPTRVGVSQADLVAGIYTALAVCAALAGRRHTGEGCHIDLSMLEAQLALATHAVGLAAVADAPPGRIGNRHPVCAPFDAFPCADGWVYVATVTDEQFERLCVALQLEDLPGDERFATQQARLDNVAELTERIAERVATETVDRVVGALASEDVPCGPVRDLPALIDDPQITARGALGWLEPWGGGSLPVPGQPFLLDGRRPFDATPAPELGTCQLDDLEAQLNAEN
jgi:CoA:oxalate CoA-transferase